MNYENKPPSYFTDANIQRIIIAETIANMIIAPIIFMMFISPLVAFVWLLIWVYY